MWDLETIIRMNHEAGRAFEKKDSSSTNEQEEAKGIQRIFEEEIMVFDGVSFVRGLYDGKVDRCSPHSRSGDQLSE